MTEVECVLCEKPVELCECVKYCSVCFSETGDPNFCRSDVDYEEFLTSEENTQNE